jgi:uncharacterized protein
MMIRLAPDLALPIEVATQTTAIFGKRGSGKTNTAVVLAEELFKAKVPFAVVDPVDVWWGLKSSRDGKGPGLGVYVFGGRHADLPLEPTAGALIADVLIDHRISAVLSVKHFSGGERSRFVTDFAKRIYQRNTEPLHVFLEEAHELAPQMAAPGNRRGQGGGSEAEMVGAVSRLWKLGRSSGIGGSAITQRPASLSKNITTQAEILVVHRTIGPQDVAAIKAWIQYHGERDDILPQLSELKTGEAFVWAPDFPEGKPIGLRRVRIRERETFDSSATPKAGEHRAEPKALAPVDLEKLRDRMAQTIERAQADDPKELRKRVLVLERERDNALQGLQKMAAGDPDYVARLQGEAADAANDRLGALIEGVRSRAIEAFEQIARDVDGLISEAVDKLATELGHHAVIGPQDVKRAPGAAEPRGSAAAVRAPHTSTFAPSSEAAKVSRPPAEGIDGPMQRVLDALAWLESAGLAPPFSREQVAFLASYKPGTGAFQNALGRLRSADLIAYPSGGTVALTDEGRSNARHPETPTTADELQRRVLHRIDGPMVRCLEPLLRCFPRPMTREELAEAAQYQVGTGAFQNALGRLRTLGCIEYPDRGHAVAREWLFLEVER